MGFGGALKSILGGIAPIIGTALGGPFGGAAAKILADKLNLPTEGKSTEQIQTEAEAVLAAPNSEAFLKVKEAEYEFKKWMADNNVKEQELVFKDISDARQREIRTKDQTNKQLAFILTGMLAGVIATMFIMAFVGTTVSESILSTLTLLLGVLIGDHKQVISYYFGSSRGSADKTELLAKGQK